MATRCLAILGCALLWLAAAERAAAGADDAPPPPDLNKHVMPLLKAKCIRCHGEKRREGELDMRTLPALLEGGVTGPALVPGDANGSLLVELIHFDEMPPKKEKPRVTKDELNLLRKWINGMKAKPPAEPN